MQKQNENPQTAVSIVTRPKSKQVFEKLKSTLKVPCELDAFFFFIDSYLDCYAQEHLYFSLMQNYAQKIVDIQLLFFFFFFLDLIIARFTSINFVRMKNVTI